jgi:hypothetical protein
MILVWDSIKSFQQHLEDMRQFRRSHFHNESTGEPRMLKTMPIPINFTLSQDTGLVKDIYNSRGKLILVPIWRITPSRGSQN